MQFRSVMTLGAALLISGCATKTYAPAAKLSPDETRAVFIRQCAAPSAWNVFVDVDGKRAASIANNAYSIFAVPPGPHEIKIKWPFLSGGVDLAGEEQFQPGRTAYYVIMGEISGASRGGQSGILIESAFGAVPEAVGVALMAEIDAKTGQSFAQFCKMPAGFRKSPPKGRGTA